MKKDFVTIIEKSLQKIGIDAVPPIDVEVPPGENFGDLSTPVALALAKGSKKTTEKNWLMNLPPACMRKRFWSGLILPDLVLSILPLRRNIFIKN